MGKGGNLVDILYCIPRWTKSNVLHKPKANNNKNQACKPNLKDPLKMGLWFGSLSLWNGQRKDTLIGVYANSKSPGVDGLQREGGSRGNKGMECCCIRETFARPGWKSKSVEALDAI